MNFNNYEIREMDEDDFIKVQTPLREKVFEKDHSIFPGSYFTHDEKETVKKLGEQMNASRFRMYLGVFNKDGKFIGWSWGYQEDAYRYYMVNSAILPEYRRQGIYSALVDYNIKKLTTLGYQLIYSRHNASNNSVIIPKLKAGFTIGQLEIDDMFGVLVHLKYYTNPIRKKILDYRTGQSAPDDEIKRLFGL